jgi:hypothetical protein
MTQPNAHDRARRRSGGYGRGEGAVGLVDNADHSGPTCTMCPAPAVLYFVDSAEEEQDFACLAHAGAVAYDVAVTSTANPALPDSKRGPDDRRRHQ